MLKCHMCDHVYLVQFLKRAGDKGVLLSNSVFKVPGNYIPELTENMNACTSSNLSKLTIESGEVVQRLTACATLTEVHVIYVRCL